jgi:integrase
MAKIQRGQGRIYEASGSYYVQYYTGRIIAGTKGPIREQKSERLCSKDDKHCVKRLKGEWWISPALRDLRDKVMVRIREHRQQGRTNESAQPKDMKIADFWEQVYQPFIEQNKAPRTVVGYKKIWSQFLKPHFGESTLRQYSTGQGTKFVTVLSSKYSRATLQHIRALGSAIFSHAIAIEILGKDALQVNPWHGVRNLAKPKETEPTPHYTLREIQAIIAALEEHPHAQLLMALTFFCGLRPSEAIGLDWSDFTDREGFLHVQRAVVNGVIGKTKTSDDAFLPLIEPVVSLLNVWHQQCEHPATGWVFPGERKGKPMNIPNLVARVIRPVLAQNKIEWKGLYAGRRGGATMLVELTKGLVAPQELLRHKTMVTTANFYKKQTQSALPEGLKLLEAAASNGK